MSRAGALSTGRRWLQPERAGRQGGRGTGAPGRLAGWGKPHVAERTFGIFHDQLILPIYPRRVKNKWKPVVAFAKPPVGPAPEWVLGGIVGAGRDKRYHEWGQQEAEAVYFIENLTKPGALVVDCYTGCRCTPCR